MLNYFFISGVSYLCLFISFFYPFSKLASLVPFLLIAFSFPHFMVSYWIWFARVRNWRSEWLVISFPVIYLSSFFLSIQGHLGEFAVDVLLKFSFLYLLYHFAQQLYGVFSWVIRQNDIAYPIWRKRISRIYFLSGCAYFWLEMETRVGAETVFYHKIANWHFDSRFVLITFMIFIASFIFILFASLLDYFKQKRIHHLFPLGPAGLVWIWFVPPMSFDFILFLPIFHAIQYLPFVLMKLKKNNFALNCRIAFICVVSGWFLFRYIPFANPFQNMENTLWASMILSLLNNHHFLIDGRIWKLSDPLNADLRR